MVGAASTFQTGYALGIATMLSVGPTNLTVMRESLTRGRTLWPAWSCSSCRPRSFRP